MANNDLQLVTAAQKGNQRAFTKLFDNYRTSIFNFVSIMIKNPTDAEDVTLVIFTKAFKSIDSYDTKYNFSTWLYKIAVNTCIDFLKGKQKKPIFTDNIIEEVESYVTKLPDKGFTPEDILITTEQLAKFKKLTNKMNPTFKKMMEMRFEQGKSYTEIAEELGVKTGTVSAQLYRAKRALYKLLKQTE